MPLPDPILSNANIDRAFGLVAFIANRHLVDHMRRLSRELELDLESVFIWGTLAQLNVAGALRPGLDPATVLDPTGMVPTTSIRPVRLSDLAQISGLPRETVPRKLKGLQERGKVARNGDGHWQSQVGGVDDSARAFNAETVRRLINTADQLRTVLAQVQRQMPAALT